MSHVVSIRLKDDQLVRLKRFARRAGKTQSEMGAQFIEEAMREAEFAFIEFRNNAVGREAYMKGSRVQVWMVIVIAKGHGMSLERTAEYFNRPEEWVQAAFNYYRAFPQQIDDAIADYESITFEDLQRKLPGIRRTEISIDSQTNESAA